MPIENIFGKQEYDEKKIENFYLNIFKKNRNIELIKELYSKLNISEILFPIISFINTRKLNENFINNKIKKN